MEGQALEVVRDVAVVNAVRDVVPDEIERDFPHIEACILSARVGLEVLKHYKVRTRAIPCSIAIYNEAAVKRITAEKRLPKSRDELLQWEKQDGSYAVGGGKGKRVGTPGQPGAGFEAHIVLLSHYQVTEDFDGILVDLALGQQSRPQRKMNLEAVTATTPDGFLGGDKPCMVDVNGCTVRYQHLPAAMDWAATPDWRDQERRHFIIERSVKKINLKLASLGLMEDSDLRE